VTILSLLAQSYSPIHGHRLAAASHVHKGNCPAPLKPCCCYLQRHFSQDQAPETSEEVVPRKPLSGCLIRPRETEDKYLHPLSSVERKPPAAIIFIFVVHLLFESVININIFQTLGKASPSHKKTLQLRIIDSLMLRRTSKNCLWSFPLRAGSARPGCSGPWPRSHSANTPSSSPGWKTSHFVSREGRSWRQWE